MRVIRPNQKAVREALAGEGWRFSLTASSTDLKEHRDECRGLTMPVHSELAQFKPRNAWSLHNAFTGIAQKMPLTTRLPAIQSVGKMFGMTTTAGEAT